MRALARVRYGDSATFTQAAMMHAIETRYAGCRFRSRLEARWAVFFDALEVPWEYESQGYDIDALVGEMRADKGPGWMPDIRERVGWYLPDFWLPRQRAWIEIKGAEPGTGGPVDQRLWAFGAALREELVAGRQFVVCFGGIPRGGGVGEDHAHQYAPYWDNYWQWNRCRGCGSLDMQYEGRAGRNYCGCEHGEKWDPDPRILAAYERARSARFEHGETPWTP